MFDIRQFHPPRGLSAVSTLNTLGNGGGKKEIQAAEFNKSRRRNKPGTRSVFSIVESVNDQSGVPSCGVAKSLAAHLL
jgi:hypothetical protein